MKEIASRKESIKSERSNVIVNIYYTRSTLKQKGFAGRNRTREQSRAALCNTTYNSSERYSNFLSGIDKLILNLQLLQQAITLTKLALRFV